MMRRMGLFLVLVCFSVASVSAEEGNRKFGGWVIAGIGGGATFYFASQALGAWSRADELERDSQNSDISYGSQLVLYERATEEWELGNEARNQALLSAAICGVGMMAALRSDPPQKAGASRDGIEFHWQVSPAGALVGIRGVFPCQTSQR